MAEVVASKLAILVTEDEWRLIMRSLASFGGVKVSTRPEEQERAAALNRQLLAQRRKA